MELINIEPLTDLKFDDDEYGSVIVSGSCKHTVPRFAYDPSTYIPVKVKHLIRYGLDTYIIDENNVPYLANTMHDVTNQMMNDTLISAVDNQTKTQIGNFVDNLRHGGASEMNYYDSYTRQFKRHAIGRTIVLEWNLFTKEDCIPLIKRLMTRTTCFTLTDDNSLVIYSRGQRWVFNKHYHAKSRSSIIPSKHSRNFTMDPVVLRVGSQSYAVYQPMTNVIYYAHPTKYSHPNVNNLLVKLPDKYDIINVAPCHESLHILMTDKNTGMLYYCVYDAPKIYNKANWTYFMVGYLHLYSTTPELHIIDKHDVISYVQGNRLNVLSKYKFYPIGNYFL